MAAIASKFSDTILIDSNRHPAFADLQKATYDSMHACDTAEGMTRSASRLHSALPHVVSQSRLIASLDGNGLRAIINGVNEAIEKGNPAPVVKINAGYTKKGTTPLLLNGFILPPTCVTHIHTHKPEGYHCVSYCLGGESLEEDRFGTLEAKSAYLAGTVARGAGDIHRIAADAPGGIGDIHSLKTTSGVEALRGFRDALVAYDNSRFGRGARHDTAYASVARVLDATPMTVHAYFGVTRDMGTSVKADDLTAAAVPAGLGVPAPGMESAIGERVAFAHALRR
jgi:hypothetical protein